MKKLSISFRINHLIIICMMVLSIFMIGINVVITNFYSSYTSSTLLKLTCSSKKNEINDQLKLVEHSVKNIFEVTEAIRPSYDELMNLQKSNEFIEQFKKIAYAITENTLGAVAVYYRLNPELNGLGDQGFFYVKDLNSGQFHENEITDLLKYDADDVEHVGWYYIPVKTGKAIWMEPYYNANIDVKMISYVKPIYEDSKLVGVVGMDIDFESIIDITKHIDIYENSGSALASFSNSEVYCTDSTVFGKSLSDDLFFILANSENFGKDLTYKSGSESYLYHFDELNNGMKIMVYVNQSDINSQRNTSILVGGAIFVVGLLIAIVFAFRMSKKITKPIKDITDAAKKFAEGDWNATVSCETNDELKELTDSISVMANKTKDYLEYINNLAKNDALTGLKNKTAYIQYIKQIKQDFEGNQGKYAVIVFDLNNLKYINDAYGHEKGDQLLKNASSYICNCFVHSPVFRIGGDEFVAILYTEDYVLRNKLHSSMLSDMEKQKNRDDVNDVCIASGMACFPEDGSSYDEVFAVADKRMYENKLKLKGGVDSR